MVAKRLSQTAGNGGRHTSLQLSALSKKIDLSVLDTKWYVVISTCKCLPWGEKMEWGWGRSGSEGEGEGEGKGEGRK